MDFPAFVPSSRNYNSGDYAVRTFRAQSGAESRILYGDSRFGTTLELQYQNIADKNAETFMVHYENMKGTFKTFPVSAGVMGGWDGLSFPDGFPYKNQRNSDATYIDQEGIIRTAGPGETRVSYDLNGNSTGLLTEQESTNFVYPSIPLSPAWRARFATATTRSNVADPAGGNEAVLIEIDGTQKFGEVTKEFDASGQTVCAVSFFAKADPLTNPENRIITTVFANVTPGQVVSLLTLYLNFFGDVAFIPRDAYSNYKREYYGNDWYRFSFLATAPFTRRSRIDFDVTNGISPTVWGAQVEPGTEVTSYIPTTDEPARRAADSISVIGAWRYAEPPDITSVRPGISNARVRLISVV